MIMSAIRIKTREEIGVIREGGRILAGILRELAGRTVVGVSAFELDKLAEELVEKAGGKPSFKGYGGYPASICVSMNSEVVHGIPSKDKVFKPGDLVGLDLGMEYRGYFSDAALTVGVGGMTREAGKLLKVTKKSLMAGIKRIKPGKTVGDIGYGVQRCVERAGFSVVRDLVGHGVGHGVHEEPAVPNFGRPGIGPRLKEGMVIAIEPMVNQGTYAIETLPDGYTIVTADGKLSAHFEHTVAVTKDGYEILTK